MFITTIAGSSSGGGLAAPTNSLDFDGAGDYLSMTSANFGAYDRTQWSFICSFNVDSAQTDRNNPLLYKGTGPGADFQLQVDITSGEIDVTTRDTSNVQALGSFNIPSFALDTWYALKVDFDGSQTGADRVKVYINGTQLSGGSASYPAEVQTGTEGVEIGRNLSGLHFHGNIYYPTFISGYTPSNADVFDGTAGKLKDLSGLTGLWSSVRADSDVVTDEVLATDWAANGNVTTSASVP